MTRALGIAIVLASAPALADETLPEAAPEAAPEAEASIADRGGGGAAAGSYLPALAAGPVEARVFGSLRPTAVVANRANAAPRDRWAYGITGSRIDAGLDTRVRGGLSALLYVTLATERDETDGSTTARVGIERALVAWQPLPYLGVAAGRDQVPLSAQSATPSYARVFPDRIALDETFVLPADVGAQATFATEYVSVLAGVWNGISSDVMLEPGATERGLLYSARVEATPLGKLAYDEGARPDGLRLGIGASATYRPATAYTPTGAAGSRSRDLRAAASVRVAWRGLFVQGEVLRRQITDDLSMRPDVATGGYLQASWRFAAGPVDVAPLGRAGLVRVRQLSAPATGSSVELGAAVFPLARETDRLQLATVFARQVDPDLGTELQILTQLRLGF